MEMLAVAVLTFPFPYPDHFGKPFRWGIMDWGTRIIGVNFYAATCAKFNRAPTDE